MLLLLLLSRKFNCTCRKLQVCVAPELWLLREHHHCLVVGISTLMMLCAAPTSGAIDCAPLSLYKKLRA